MAPTRVQAGGKSVPIVGIPGQPGEYIAAPILADVLYIAKKYKAKITDGFASSGHSAAGEHPAGLAVDLVPDFARGGTWDDLDRLARDAGWGPGAFTPSKGPFRFVGWDGYPNHGRGNHLHLSWRGKGSAPLQTWTSGDQKGKGFGDVLKGAAGDALGSVVPGGAFAGGVAGDLFGSAASAGAGLATDVAGELVGLIFDALGEKGARILLYIGLVGSGTALAVVGVSRLAGVRTPSPGAIAAAIPVTRGAKK